MASGSAGSRGSTIAGTERETSGVKEIDTEFSMPVKLSAIIARQAILAGFHRPRNDRCLVEADHAAVFYNGVSVDISKSNIFVVLMFVEQ
nr:hypothetical protein [uncultured Dysosmobacter sp.]